MNTIPPPRLHVGEDADFQRQSWRFQSVGFGALLVFLVAGALGLLGGGGPLNPLMVSRDGVRVEGERFVRFGTTTAFAVRAPAAPGAIWEIAIGGDFPRGTRVDAILPPPESVAEADGATLYAFPPASQNAALATFHYTPELVGALSVTIRSGATEPIHFTQFVLP